MRRTIPALITLVVGFSLVVQPFVPPFEVWSENVAKYVQIIAAFAFFLGGASLVKINFDKIRRRQMGWGYPIVTLVGFFGMMIVGLFKIGNPDGFGGELTANGSLFNDMFVNILTPLNASTYSLLAFFIASASYRAFRAKNTDATILLAAAFVILLGRTFLGAWLTQWMPDALTFFKIDNLSLWLMTYPNTAGQRAIMIGIALGVVSMSLRVILGVERSHLGSGKE